MNIRLDYSVVDQSAGAPPQTKTLMVMLADGATARTRGAFEDRQISVDARPELVDGRMRVSVTIESGSARFAGPPTQDDATITWRNSFTLLLDNGKPMVALETIDAATTRRLAIEVKATIQK